MRNASVKKHKRKGRTVKAHKRKTKGAKTVNLSAHGKEFKDMKEKMNYLRGLRKKKTPEGGTT